MKGVRGVWQPVITERFLKGGGIVNSKDQDRRDFWITIGKLAFLVIVGFSLWAWGLHDIVQSDKQKARERGSDAYLQGASDSANPFVHDPTRADAWLQGWLDAKNGKAEK